jgi:hypothetical protein
MTILSYKKLYGPALLVILSLLALIAGCARPRSLSMLDDDVLSRDQGYESIVFWRVKVLDKTGTIKSRPRFSIFRPGPVKQEEHSFDKPIPEPAAVKGEWTKQDGNSVFEAMVFAASKPEEYLFKDVTFPLYTDYVPNYYTGRYEEREVTFTVPLSRVCTIPTGKLVYLGEISIEFLKEDRAGYAYRVHIVQENNDFNDAVKQFREAYPGLFRRFNKTVDSASWKVLFIENFVMNKNAWTVPAGDKHVFSELSDGKYLMQSKNDECHWSGIMPSFDRPQNFDIELVSTGKSEADAQGFGLAVGNDRDNAYNFLVGGNGQAKVELYKNGELQPALIPWKDVAAGKASETMVSRQKIEARGDILRYFVNDEYVGEIKNEFEMKDWFLGLAVCGRQTVAFDQLRLIER